jgi:ABC-type transporter lipoprotein component MlaA
VVLVVLALRLSLFAYGQEPAVGFTRPPAAETVVLPKSVPDPIEPFNRVMWGFNKALMTGVIKPSSRVYRCETGPNRNRKFWQEPHLPGTIDQQSASGKVERSAR